VDEINRGRNIWRPVELKTRRELARAWLTWGLPDRCATNAKELAAKSSLLGKALSYNNPSATDAPAPAPPPMAPDTPASDAPAPGTPAVDAPKTDAPPTAAPTSDAPVSTSPPPGV